MAIFNTQKFIQGAVEKGFNEQQITQFLNNKGIDITKPQQEITPKGKVNFLERLKLSFGDKESKEQQQQLEKQAGLKGKFDVGDIADVAGAIPGLAGFIAGDIAGGIPGGALGGAAGEAIKQGIGKVLGVQKKFEPGKVATEGITGLAAGGIAKLGGKAIKFGLEEVKPLANIAKKGIAGVKKVLPGISEETASTIAKYPIEVEKLAAKTTLPSDYLVKDVVKSRVIADKSINKAYERGWSKLMKEGEKYAFDKPKVIDSINQFITKEAQKGKFYFNRTSKGALDFTNSPFTDEQAKGVISKIITKLETAAPKNIGEIRALKQYVNNIYREYSSKLGQSPELNRFVTNMLKSVDEGLPAKLKALSKSYSEGLRFLDTIDELLLPTSNVTGKVKMSAITKLKSISKEEIRNLYPEFFTEFKKRTGYDLSKALDIFNAAKEINPNLIPQDIGGFVRGIQKAMNPMIGQGHIEAAKGTIPGQQAIKGMKNIFQPGLKKASDIISPIKKPAAKGALFQFLRGLSG